MTPTRTKRRADPVDLWQLTLAIDALTGTATVVINGQSHELHISPLTRVATLTKADGQVYTVGGARPCDCPDMHFRKRWCKHRQALAKLLPFLLPSRSPPEV